MGYVATVLSDSPVGFWRCREASGNLADSGSGNVTATAAGTSTYGVAGACDSDTAITPNGSTGKFTVANASTNITGAATLECWAKPTNNPANHSGVCGFRNDTTCDFYLLQLQSTNTYETRYIGSNGTAVGVATFSATANAWHHFVLTWDGNGATGVFEAWLDGVSQGTATGSTSNVTITTVAMGIGTEGTNFFGGTIAEVALYSSKLTSTRISAHFNAGNNYAPFAPQAVSAHASPQAVKRAATY